MALLFCPFCSLLLANAFRRLLLRVINSLLDEMVERMKLLDQLEVQLTQLLYFLVFFSL